MGGAGILPAASHSGMGGAGILPAASHNGTGGAGILPAAAHNGTGGAGILPAAAHNGTGGAGILPAASHNGTGGAGILPAATAGLCRYFSNANLNAIGLSGSMNMPTRRFPPVAAKRARAAHLAPGCAHLKCGPLSVALGRPSPQFVRPVSRRLSGPRRYPLIASLLAAFLLLPAGCQNKGDGEKRFALQPPRSAQDEMLRAVETNDPDVRRKSLARVSKSRSHDQDWAIEGYVAIALLESDSQSRSVALRGLDRTTDPRASETALKILNHKDYPPEQVTPPDGLVRADSLRLLADHVRAGHIPAGATDAVREAFIRHLRGDTHREARQASARGLAGCRHADALTALIGGLEDADFAVVYECENSLKILTGQALPPDAAAWREWASAHPADAFAEARDPAPPPNNAQARMEKMAHEFRLINEWLWPAEKKK